MAAERAQNLQDTFLNHVRKTKTPLTIFLVNGVKLQGIVTWFDNFCLLLRRDGHSQLVYKHAISTIMPGAPIQLFEGERGRTELEKDLIGTPSKKEGRRRPSGSAEGNTAGRVLVIGPYLRHGRRWECAADAALSRSVAARLEEAAGLARAIDLDVRGRHRRAARPDPACDLSRQGQGRRNRRPRQRA